MPGKAVSRERVLSNEEIRKVWHGAEEMGYPFGSVVQLLMLTALRLNEVAKAKWDDIDLEVGVWRIPRENVKADRSHEVPLSKQAIAIFKALPRFTDAYVFTSTAGKSHISGFSKAKARLDKFSGVTDWRLHDLRRTAGTNMAKLGVPVYTISRVLNHAQGGVTAIYDRHSYMPEKKEALKKWARKLDQILLSK
jgi:integrase